jgi:hypothetical protein
MDPDQDAVPDPAIFAINLQDANKKLIFLKFLCRLLFEGTFTSFFKDKKSKRIHKAEESRFYLLFLLDDERIRIRIRMSQKLMDPMDPDPEHCLQ